MLSSCQSNQSSLYAESPCTVMFFIIPSENPIVTFKHVSAFKLLNLLSRSTENKTCVCGGGEGLRRLHCVPKKKLEQVMFSPHGRAKIGIFTIM